MKMWKWSAIKYGDHRNARQLMEGERLQKLIAIQRARLPVVIQHRIAAEKEPVKVVKLFAASQR